MTATNSAVVWRGPSAFDPSVDVLVVLTGLQRPSTNPKTGPMIQSWILRADGAELTPYQAMFTGADAPICGTCPLRANRGCYVTVNNAPNSIMRAILAGKTPDMPLESAMDALRGRKLRIGAYGDPAAVPFSVWETLLTFASGHTGYTHAWRDCDPRFASIVMASVEDRRSLMKADDKGWRAFYVSRDPVASIPSAHHNGGRRVITCPASAEASHRTTCHDCGLCDGTYALDKRAHITIQPHGAKAARVTTGE